MSSVEQQEVTYAEPEASDGWVAGAGFGAAVAALHEGMSRLFHLYVEGDSVTHFVARSMATVRRETRNADGRPDWKGESSLYKLNVGDWLDSFIAENMPYPENADVAAKKIVDQRRKKVRDKINANGRQDLGRGGMLEETITNHVIATTPNLGDLTKLRWAGPEVGPDEDPNAAAIVLTGNIPAKVKNAIAEEYRKTYGQEGVPAKFGGPKGQAENEQNGSGRASTPKTVVESIASAAEGIKPEQLSETLFSEYHRLTSAISQAVREAEEIAGGMQVALDSLSTDAAILTDTVSVRSGKYGRGDDFDKVEARLAANYWKAPEK